MVKQVLTAGLQLPLVVKLEGGIKWSLDNKVQI